MVEHSATSWIIVAIVTLVLFAAVTRILRRWDYVRRRLTRSWVGQVQSGILMAVVVVTALLCMLLTLAAFDPVRY